MPAIARSYLSKKRYLEVPTSFKVFLRLPGLYYPVSALDNLSGMIEAARRQGCRRFSLNHLFRAYSDHTSSGQILRFFSEQWA